MPDLTYRISAADYADFKAAFLRAHPVPVDPATNMAIMPDADWIKRYGRDMFMSMYRRGKEQLAVDAAVVDETIVEMP